MWASCACSSACALALIATVGDNVACTAHVRLHCVPVHASKSARPYSSFICLNNVSHQRVWERCVWELGWGVCQRPAHPHMHACEWSSSVSVCALGHIH